MLEITLSGSLDRMRESIPQIAIAVKTRLDVLDVMLQSRIVSEKLSGQVLQHRTGKLASSIRVIPAEQSGLQISGFVEGGGGPAFYGKFHEYGTDRQYTIAPVTKKALAFMVNGKQIIVKSVTHPPIQERSFMRSTLNEMRSEIVASIQEAANSV